MTKTKTKKLQKTLRIEATKYKLTKTTTIYKIQVHDKATTKTNSQQFDSLMETKQNKKN